MRKLIAGMKITLDGKVQGDDEMADWVESWADDYGVMPDIDACILGSGMYAGYEHYWSGIQAEPETVAWITGTPPTPAERDWAQFIKTIPHYVLSHTQTEAQWPLTRFLKNAEEVAALKAQPGRDIYLIGGAQTTARLMDEGLVDELRLIIYPLICGDGKGLFASAHRRRGLRLQKAQALPDGRLHLTYGLD